MEEVSSKLVNLNGYYQKCIMQTCISDITHNTVLGLLSCGPVWYRFFFIIMSSAPNCSKRVGVHIAYGTSYSQNSRENPRCSPSACRTYRHDALIQC